MLSDIIDAVVSVLREAGYPVSNGYDNSGAADGSGAVVVGVGALVPLHHPYRDYQIQLEIKTQIFIEEDRNRAKIRAMMSAIYEKTRTVTPALLLAASGEKIDAVIPAEGTIFSDNETHNFIIPCNIYAQDLSI